MIIDKSKLTKSGIEYLEIVNHYFEEELRNTKYGAKKQYTPGQVNRIHANLFSKIRYSFELKKKYGESEILDIIDLDNKKIKKCILEYLDIKLNTCEKCDFNKICEWIKK